MPFHSMMQDSVLTDIDLDFLQEVYEASAADVASIDDATMHEVVETLIMYYRDGERDKASLIAMAKRDLRRAG